MLYYAISENKCYLVDHQPWFLSSKVLKNFDPLSNKFLKEF